MPKPAVNRGVRDEIQAREGQQFAAALFFKPAPGDASSLVASLAPLLFIETPTNRTHEALPSDRFGQRVTTPERVRIDLERPTVYYETDNLAVNGRLYPRLNYRWYYFLTETNDSGRSRIGAQGVRLTLDNSGRPVIWEILDDTSGVPVVFVAESLEHQARHRFGGPLPGRKYSVENDVIASPQIVVARVIEDGPVAMGPAVYLQKTTRSVMTLICRCMPPQTTQLGGTQIYQLLPRESGSVAPVEDLWDTPYPPAWVQALRVLPE
jgi:hypothetical protein